MIERMFDAGNQEGSGLLPAGSVPAWRAVAGGDVHSMGESQLMDTLREVEALRRALDATTAHLAAELDARDVTDRVHGLRTNKWMAWALEIPAGVASRAVRLGNYLRDHPVSDTALVQGRISVDHINVLSRACSTRVCDVFDAIEEHLIDLACGTNFDVWSRTVTALLDHADPDGAHQPRPEANNSSRSWGLEGDWHLALDLVGEAALEADAALEAETDELFHRYNTDAEMSSGELAVPDRNTLRALAALELFRKGRANGHSGSGPVADVTIVVTTPPDLPAELRAPTEGQSDSDWMEGLLAFTLDRMPVSRSTAALLCCDPKISVLVEDFTGETLDLGRTRRFASTAQRKAAGVRYGGCCFPGCDAPTSWTDMHHVAEWDAEGGTTDQHNLAPLCRHHHGVIHRDGWHMTAAPHGFDITTPRGQTIPCQRRTDPA